MTGSGGFHLYFRANADGEDLRTTSKVLGYPLDVRGWHGQSVIPGSKNKHGQRYEWAPGCAPDEVALADLPPAWFCALPKHVVAVNSAKPRSHSRTYRPLRTRIANEKSAVTIGDGIGGGFHRPIYLLALRFLRDAPNLDGQLLAEIIKAKVLSAPVDPARDKAAIERYASDAYLLDQIERARAWVLRKDQ